MRLLEEIKKENEVIVEFGTTNSYTSYEYLADMDLTNDPTDDISAHLEYTLHRMMESGFTSEDIYYNCAMEIPSTEQLEECEEFNEFIHIDLGYIIDGLLTFAQVKDGE